MSRGRNYTIGASSGLTAYIDEFMTPEQAMLTQVIMLSIADLRSDRRIHVCSARQFIFGDLLSGDDVITLYCRITGFKLDRVRQVAVEYIHGEFERDEIAKRLFLTMVENDG